MRHVERHLHDKMTSARKTRKTDKSVADRSIQDKPEEIPTNIVEEMDLYSTENHQITAENLTQDQKEIISLANLDDDIGRYLFIVTFNIQYFLL